MQTYTSKMTCQNFGKPNAVYKYIPNNTKILFDYGCGKYSNNENHCLEKGIEWFGYDPYWKDDESNEETLEYVNNHYDMIDCVVCSNVLNVIKEIEVIENILIFLSNVGHKETMYLFSCYSGNKSGIGKESKKDCWQRNEKNKIWEQRLNEYFDVISIKNDILICTKKKNNDKVK